MGCDAGSKICEPRYREVTNKHGDIFTLNMVWKNYVYVTLLWYDWCLWRVCGGNQIIYPRVVLQTQNRQQNTGNSDTSLEIMGDDTIQHSSAMFVFIHWFLLSAFLLGSRTFPLTFLTSPSPAAELVAKEPRTANKLCVLKVVVTDVKLSLSVTLTIHVVAMTDVTTFESGARPCTALHPVCKRVAPPTQMNSDGWMNPGMTTYTNTKSLLSVILQSRRKVNWTRTMYSIKLFSVTLWNSNEHQGV